MRWTFLPEQAVPFLTAAIEGTGEPGSQAVGRELLRLFGAKAGPADARQQARGELSASVRAALKADPALGPAAAAIIAAFYRAQADAGDFRALVDLGDFLFWDEPAAARAAYQEAIDAGYPDAMMRLAKLLCDTDADAGAVVYQQVIDSGDPDLAPEAMVELAHLRAMFQDLAAARVLFGQAIGTRHLKWSPAAMVGLANWERHDDPGTAEVLYRQAIEAGNARWSSAASVRLGDLLAKQGDVAGARAAWQRAVDGADRVWSPAAFVELVNLLRRTGDAAGLRAAYETAAALANPEAHYALDQLARLER